MKHYAVELQVEYLRKANLVADLKPSASMSGITLPIDFLYKNDPMYAKQLWKCESCNNISSESHILWCSGFQHLREGKDLKCDRDLAKYLVEVVKIRSEK